MFSEQFVPRIGHIIYILLQMAENEKVRESKILAMNCLRNLGCSSHGKSLHILLIIALILI